MKKIPCKKRPNTSGILTLPEGMFLSATDMGQPQSCLLHFIYKPVI